MAYYGSSILVRPLMLPPTFAAPIWPAAGIAAGALILWGYKFIPAILIAEVLVNINFYKTDDFSDNPTLFVTYGLMLMATMIRSALATYLVKRFLGAKNEYLTLLSIVKLFVLAGIIPTFISSSLSTLTLYNSSLLEEHSVMLNFFTWWFGDSVGVFILLPMMFLLFKKPRKVWRDRLLKTAIPVLITFVLILIIAQNLKEFEQKRLLTIIDNKTMQLGDSVFDEYAITGNPHNSHPANFVNTINKLFVNEAGTLSQKKNYKDIHLIIEYGKNSAKTKIFESQGKVRKLVKWRIEKLYGFGEHKWKIRAYPTTYFFINNASWLIWWLLSTGFLFIALTTAGLLVITGNEIITKNQVLKRTKEIQTLNKILEEKNKRYKQLIEIQPVIFWKHTLGKCKLDFISNEASKMLGYSLDELYSLDYVLSHIIHPKDRDRVVAQYTKGTEKKEQYTIKYRALKKNGDIVWLKDYISTRIEDGNLEIIGMKIDITKEQKTQEKISQLAYFDSMTKLPNRTKFMEYLQQAIESAQHNNTFGAVLFLDLDRFKVLNDSMGHHFGDQLLIQIGERLKATLKETDVSSRFGGDEFVILIRNQNQSLERIQRKVTIVADKIQRAMNVPFNINEHIFYTSFSIGVSIFPYNSKQAEEIIQQADIAMYASKAKGKNTCTFFEKEMQTQANEQLGMEKYLKNALAKNEFEMYYQPVFDENKAYIKFESLIRWHHPTKGLLTPTNFIYIAEEIGMIVDLSAWIIEEIFAHIDACFKESSEVLPVAINISLYQFNNTKLIDTLKNAHRKYPIATSTIILELTESFAIDNFQNAMQKLDELKQMGFKIAIDDFGSGYSSLSYLAQMPIDILKLDMSFVEKIGKDENAEKLIATIVLMANQLNLELIIEGVETETQFKFLKNLGCNQFQGHLVAKAQPFNKIKANMIKS